MKSLFWTGKLSLPVMLMVNANNLVAFLNGNSRNKLSMKERVKLGYEGVFSDHVKGYDNLAAEYQKKAAIAQLSGMDLWDKEVIDIGCGTGTQCADKSGGRGRAQPVLSRQVGSSFP